MNDDKEFKISSETALKTGLFGAIGVSVASILVPIGVVMGICIVCMLCSVLGSVTA